MKNKRINIVVNPNKNGAIQISLLSELLVRKKSDRFKGNKKPVKCRLIL